MLRHCLRVSDKADTGDHITRSGLLFVNKPRKVCRFVEGRSIVSPEDSHYVVPHGLDDGFQSRTLVAFLLRRHKRLFELCADEVVKFGVVHFAHERKHDPTQVAQDNDSGVGGDVLTSDFGVELLEHGHDDARHQARGMRPGKVSGYQGGELLNVPVRQLLSTSEAVVEEREEVDLLYSQKRSADANAGAREGRDPNRQLGRVVLEQQSRPQELIDEFGRQLARDRELSVEVEL